MCDGYDQNILWYKAFCIIFTSFFSNVYSDVLHIYIGWNRTYFVTGISNYLTHYIMLYKISHSYMNPWLQRKSKMTKNFAFPEPHGESRENR